MKKSIWQRIKDKLVDTIICIDPEDDTICMEPIEEEQLKIIEYIKEKFKLKKIKSKKDSVKHKQYLNRDQAIHIANSENNLKKSLYKEAIDNGFIYGIIEFNDFYTTLVKYKDELFWYVKVIDGRYGIKDDERNKKGLFDKYSNIRCLINATTGKFIYIDDYFDTRYIRMITDDEFLEIVFDFKQ